MGDLAEILLELFPSAVLFILKSIWSGLLYIFSFGYITFSKSWESKMLDRFGVLFAVLLFIGTVLYFTFRGSYYFN